MADSPSHFVASGDLRLKKIRGEKVFASDFRAVDLAKSRNWPENCSHALLIRATCTNRIFNGLILARLSDGLRPDVTVTGDMLLTRGINNHLKNGSVFLLCPPGETPQFLSQPLAILIFNDFLSFRRASQELREDRGIVDYGPIGGGVADKPLLDILTDWRKLIAPPGPRNTKHYIHPVVPGRSSSQWEGGTLNRSGNAFVRTSDKGVVTPDPTADSLYTELTALGPNSLTVETMTFTQQVDPAFMEPEAGLAYLKDGLLTLVSGTQSPFSDLDDLQFVFGISPGPPKGDVLNVDVVAVDPGGGFGGRDKAPFAAQLAMAAAFSNRPVRLAYDRFEQFQAGIKRHGSAVHSLLSVSSDGVLDKALIHFVFEGGADVNLGSSVMGLGALHATGFYRFNIASTNGAFTARPVPIVGSMRGFGIPQVIFNVETAIDRLASLNLGLDPLEFRLRNVLKSDSDRLKADCDVAGTPLVFHVANEEICKLAAAHTIWLTRNDIRKTYAENGVYRGVGFAGCIEAYGAGHDSTFAAVKLELDGTITVLSETADMGQGARRSLTRVASQIFGVDARASLGELQPFVKFQDQFKKTLTDEEKNSIPNNHTSSSASKTAFFHVHVLSEAAKALMRFKVHPAVRSITGLQDSDALLSSGFKHGIFTVSDGRKVPLSQVAQYLNQMGDERFAIAHGAFTYGWTKATFTEVDLEPHDAFIDALAFGTDEYAALRLVARSAIARPPLGAANIPPPRSGYASAGHLVAVEIDPKSRRIRVTDAVAFIDAGDPVVESILQGQIEGGFQMGVAHALFEELPPESGQDRFVNFDRYIIPRASDVASIHLSSVLIPLPPGGALNADQANIRHKGVGEVTMTTVAPAIANAIAHALGATNASAWPSKLPIRFSDLAIPGGPDA
ncbi:xanthine dehydrogenase family protein molybdopterin-binding subunit [Pseudomonas moorei]|uniref:xanthine dehydrogenase family protein molybdopterin-binding subunit n=1 Tax=Pseudomonas moorei TaxID=395599 RepID=UPI001FF5A642|nr:molybdopterin cofactor-binding domain-containing protein [Pseudomonas moorei]